MDNFEYLYYGKGAVRRLKSGLKLNYRGIDFHRFLYYLKRNEPDIEAMLYFEEMYFSDGVCCYICWLPQHYMSRQELFNLPDDYMFFLDDWDIARARQCQKGSLSEYKEFLYGYYVDKDVLLGLETWSWD